MPDGELASGRPGFAWRRGVLFATKTAPMCAVAGVRAALATVLAADRARPVGATSYGEPTREA